MASDKQERPLEAPDYLGRLPDDQLAPGVRAELDRFRFGLTANIFVSFATALLAPFVILAVLVALGVL